MQISDIKGMSSFDFIAEIEEYAEKIFSDNEIRDILLSEFERSKEAAQRDIKEDFDFSHIWGNLRNLFGYGAVVRIMCTRYKNETASILAIMNGTTAEELDLNPFEIIGQLKEMLKEIGTDGIKLFFFSAQKTEDKSSGSATENTEDGLK